MFRSFYHVIGRVVQYPTWPVLSLKRADRVRLAVVTRDGYVLLVRNWFGRQNWTLPGGGVRGGESSAEAAVRELYEETGVVVDAADVELVETSTCNESCAPFSVTIYRVLLDERCALRPDGTLHEIIDQKWCQVDQLPRETALPIGEILQK